MNEATSIEVTSIEATSIEATSFEVTIKEAGLRLDIFAAEALNLSRSNIQRHIEEGHVQVNLLHVPKRYVVRPGDIITCAIPEPVIYDALPEPIPLDIAYEDSDIIVINKPQNMVVHPAPGHFTGTLVNALLYHCRDLSGVNGVLRPGIVHRLDKDTSGLIVVAKNDTAHHGLASQLADRTMGRFYWGLVHGIMEKDALTINKNIGRHPVDRKKMAVLSGEKGKTAITHITVLERYKVSVCTQSPCTLSPCTLPPCTLPPCTLPPCTLVEAKLETGRTHQIRVHMAHIGHPILNDPVYGPKAKPQPNATGQFLHAKSLQLIHPVTGKNMHFETDLPQYFQNPLNTLN